MKLFIEFYKFDFILSNLFELLKNDECVDVPSVNQFDFVA